MDIVVINLASQPDRWRHTRDRLAEAGLQARRVEAVDGAALTPGEIARLYDPQLNARQHHKPLRPGEIGCYASHLAVWRQLLDSHERAVAVLEDDVEPDPALRERLEALAGLPAGWDLIKLFGRRRELVAERRPLVAGAPAGAELVGYRRVPSHTCAYAVSRRGAHKLLHSRVPFGRPIDVDLRHWWENDLAVYGVQPYPVARAESSRVSTIDDGRRGCTGPAMRARKIGLQLRYALLNWLQARQQGAAGARLPRRAGSLSAPLAAPLAIPLVTPLATPLTAPRAIPRTIHHAGPVPTQPAPPGDAA